MKYRNIYISNRCHLSTRNNCLVINNGEIDSVPIEDIRCVLIDNVGTTISTAALSKLAEYGASVILCNNKHLPTSILEPINQYCRRLKRLDLQLEQTVPAKKRLWTQIVKGKISNQSKCLELIGDIEGCQYLGKLINSVKVGDPSNIEGKAAAYYFKALYGKTFRRREENEINASLDYGYSIIRSYIARTISVYGLEPSIGIHHKNELNNFNLADDLLEPFRPVVDLYTIQHMDQLSDFSTAYRAQLLSILNMDMVSNGNNCSLTQSIEQLVQNLVACFEKKQTTLFVPELIELRYHKYE